MAFSYLWSDLITLVSKQVKNIPTQSIDALHCDLVSSRIASRLSWRFMQTTIADGQIPLVDGQQDYDPPFNIWRLTDASLCCTSVLPNDDVTIGVRDTLAVDMLRRSPYCITSCCLQPAAGQLRLSCAPAIPQGTTWELRGSYQINPTKVTSTQQPLWFDDRYVFVAVEGLKYWYFSMADDPRAGTTSGNWPGDISYSGQLGQFMSAIKEMSDAEDIGGDMQAMPDDALGIRYPWFGLSPFFGSGGGGTGGGGGGGGGGVGINFADDETVAGSGTSWTLAHSPSPTASLTLYQVLPGFGSVLLLEGTGKDYTISGTNVTTQNSITTGALTAWYRY